jgi:hypothetical protein
MLVKISNSIFLGALLAVVVWFVAVQAGVIHYDFGHSVRDCEERVSAKAQALGERLNATIEARQRADAPGSREWIDGPEGQEAVDVQAEFQALQAELADCREGNYGLR